MQQVELIYGWKAAGDPWYLRLLDPPTNFVELAAPFGVEGVAVTQLQDLPEALKHGLEVVAAGRPYVVEVMTDPSLSPPADELRLDVLLSAKLGMRPTRGSCTGPA